MNETYTEFSDITETAKDSDYATKRLIYHFSIATSIIFFLFGILYLLKGSLLLGGFETLLGAVQVYNLYHTNRHHDFLRSSRVLVYSVQLMSLIIFATGGIGGTGNLWIFFIPLFTMLLLDRTESIRSLIGYTTLLLLLVTAHFAGLYELKYDFIELRQTILVFLLFLYLTFHNEKLKNMVRQKLQQKNIELEKTSITDHLTGLANRMYLNRKLVQEYARVQRYDQPLSLIIADLDFFKEINDTYSHLTGDEVLKKTSDLFVEHTRKSDLVGRWGGEEFMIILPETSLEGAKAMAEHLRRILEAHDFGLEHPVTASFGVTEYHNGDALESFIQQADNTLYVAKDTGRNRVIAS